MKASTDTAPGKKLRAQILMDNSAPEGLLKEWGFSVYIEYDGKKFLLDTGCGERFAENAKELGVDLSQVDFGIISHAHFDHANGMESFFAINPEAKFHIRLGAGANCYEGADGETYIGIQKYLLNEFGDRIKYVKGDFELCPGAYLIPHKTPGLERTGEAANLYIRRMGKLVPDDFAHEQSLVFDTESGLVVFNSCCHGGADNIIKEIGSTFPDKRIFAIVGGLHLYRTSDEDVRALAERIKATGIEKVVTGHCTGEKAAEILKEELGDTVEFTTVGLVFEA